MATTVAYLQEHGYGTEEDLEKAFAEAKSQTADMRKALRSTEGKLKKELNTVRKNIENFLDRNRSRHGTQEKETTSILSFVHIAGSAP